MMKNKGEKLLFIPRAIKDCLKCLGYHDVPLARRLQVAKALLHLKWNYWRNLSVHTTNIHVGTQIITVFNKSFSQFLLKEILLHQVYKPEVIKRGVVRLLDAGANVGMTAAYFNLVFQKRVTTVCLEPDGDNFMLLQLNSSNNKWNAVLKKEALGIETGIRKVSFAANESLNKSFEAPGNERVAFIAFRELVQQHFDYIKIDIEGAEWNIFKRDLSGEIITRCGYWMIEFHDVKANKLQLDKWIDLFQTNGYQYKIKDDVYHFYLGK